MGGRYVPPHLRNQAASSSSESSGAGHRPHSNGTGSYQPRHSNASHSGTYSPSHSNSHTSSTSYSHNSPRSNGGGSTPVGRNTYQRGGAGPPRRGVGLCVFGDSFAGPFKLLSDECVKVQTFKGASAKGLNNPNSIKQVSNELVPLLNTFLAPPPFAYMPATGRSALLMFGNVDLQVNYLWQLQHKPIGAGTWSEHERKTFGLKEDGTVTAPAEDEVDESDHNQIIASATENSGKGPALGPELFVDNIVHAFCAWLEREIVNGPIGRRAAKVAEQQDTAGPGAGADASSSERRLPPTRVLVAAALPPLIEDDTLPRIPEKYVERLEEDHVRAHRAMERGERDNSSAPWPKSGANSATAEIEKGLAATSLADKSTPGKQSVEALLAHDPPLCTKPVRYSMTHAYNTAMRAFCSKYPAVLAFVDIWDVMLGIDVSDRKKEAADTGVTPAAPEIPREVERATWACPVDVSNIHPLWEPTLPLWLKELATEGVPTDTFAFSADAEATFKAYEDDKRRRTETRDFRIKIRDE